MMIRPVNKKDAAQIAEIYNYYIENSVATFETEPIDSFEMEKRIDEKLTGNYPFLVAEDDRKINGYAYASYFKQRAAYAHTVEISVYIKNGENGKGIGAALYEKLFAELRNDGVRTIIAGIALPNDASVKLHEKFGMRQAAHFEEIGFKFSKWIDTGYWQIVLNK